MSTRRKFILDCSTAAAAVLWAPLSVLAKPGSPGCAAAALNYSTFSGLAGMTFRVKTAAGQAVALKLLEGVVAPAPRRPRSRRSLDAGFEKFSLFFSGPEAQPLEDGIYALEQDQIGRFELFLSRILARQPSQCRYQAVFNRPVSPIQFSRA